MEGTAGHNSIAAEHLRSIVERVERLEEEKRELAAEVKGIYDEAKGNGFDTTALRKIVAMRRKTAAQRDEEQAILDLYMSALGMLADTPLGQAAIARRGD